MIFFLNLSVELRILRQKKRELALRREELYRKYKKLVEEEKKIDEHIASIRQKIRGKLLSKRLECKSAGCL